MPLSRRLADVERTLEYWYETLGSMEQDLAKTYDARAKIAIKQQIRDDILPNIRKYEAEYWQLLAQEANSFTIVEPEASYAIVQVVQDVELIENNASNFPNEVMQQLVQIRDRLNEPGTPAAAKVKLALPLLPPVLSIEMELDSENTLRRIFQPLRRLFKGAEKEKK